MLARSAHLKNRIRLSFETDVVDDYFTRKIDRGEKLFERLLNGSRKSIADYVGPNLVDGKGTLTFDLPENAKVDDVVEVAFTVRDPINMVEFINCANLSVLAAVESSPGPKPPPKPKPGPPREGEAEGNAGISFPKVIWVDQKNQSWSTHFNSLDDCLNLIDEGEEINGKYEPSRKFYLNTDNRALQRELKSAKLSADVVKKQFEVGVVLVTMALVHDDEQKRAKQQKGGNGTISASDDEGIVEERAAEFIRAIAPVIIPMIQSLGNLADDAVELSDLVGQTT